MLANRVEAEREQLSEAVGADPVEHIAGAAIAGDGLDAEGLLAIGAGGSLLHATLELKARRSLEEEDPEGAGSGVGEGVTLVAAEAGMGQGGRRAAEGVQQATSDTFHSCFARGSPCANCDRPDVSRSSIWPAPKQMPQSAK